VTDSVTTLVERDQVQGIVFFAYKRKPAARYLFIHLHHGAKARAWLRSLLPEIDSGKFGASGKEVTQVAFTATGLRCLGLGKRSISTFPREFQQGMAAEERANVLRDTGDNAPAKWSFGGPNNPRLDAVVVVYARTDDEARALVKREEDRLAAHGAGTIVAYQEGRLDPQMREHFGFRDGISQPYIGGSHAGEDQKNAVKVPLEQRVAAGEFLFGYQNEYGLYPTSPRAYGKPGAHGGREDREADGDGVDLGRNGTFIVFRKLYQDVAAFWRYAYDQGKPRRGESPHDAATHLASRIVGRWPSGAPVVLSPDADSAVLGGENDFGFAKTDPDGLKCPFGAHIRRAQPRDMMEPGPEESWQASRRHRILRRGRAYGPRFDRPHPADDDGVERGLVFVGLCANLRRQFEFVQQTWMTNPNFASLRGEMDPLIGHDPALSRFTIPGVPARRCLASVPQFVRLLGGGYFFLPGLRALAFLAGEALLP
jgi:Dyp-type peroxidase family